MADITASVPLETNRTFWIEGTAAMIASASLPSAAVGAPKLVPSCAALTIAVVTCSCAWPRIIGP